ncbi:MAG: translocation/assembly module TamB domain-containing protein [Bacteroidaceae bacterium]|nr:translocation/assembly module TamB domain-containing protein [Bacteroidaceae bacterium]
MKYISKFIQFVVWTVALLYFVAIVLTHIPAVQKRLGEEASAIIAKELGTYCSIGSVNLGYLNRVVVEDVELKDQAHNPFLKANSIAVTPDLWDILNGKITISDAQLFGADISIYKDSEDGELNCQFFIDKLSDPDSKEPSKLNLRINTLIIRNTKLSYNLNYKPRNATAILDPNHIVLDNLRSNIVLYGLKDGDIELAVRKLAFKEKNGLELQGLSCDFEKHNDLLTLKDVDMKLTDGFLKSDSIVYNTERNRVHGDVEARYRDLNVSARVFGSKEQILVDRISLENDAKSLRLNGSGSVGMLQAKGTTWDADIKDSNVEIAELRHVLSSLFNVNIGQLPTALESAMFLSFKGKTAGVLENGFNMNPLDAINGSIDGEIKSGIGNLMLNVIKTREQLKANVKTQDLKLGTLLADNRFNLVSADVEAVAPMSLIQKLTTTGLQFPDIKDLSVKADVRHFDFDGNVFKNIFADLTLSNSILDGKLNVAPQNIASFIADMHLDISKLTEKNLTGKLTLNNLAYDKYHLEKVVADLKGDAVDLMTDVGNVSLSGDLDKKYINSTIHVSDMAKLDKLLDLDLDAQGRVDAELKLRGDSVFGKILSPELTVASLNLHNVDADFNALGKRIDSNIKLDNGNHSNSLRVALNSSVKLLENSKGGISGASVNIKPSELYVRDTLFRISESNIVYNDDVLAIKDLEIGHNQQHIIVNGRADRHSSDSIVADINDIDVAYILDFVKFHAVDFTGKASGFAVVKKLFSTPEASAMLTVEDFTFEHGRMGTLMAKASWNNEESQIDIDALCDDERRYTKIDGFVSPSRNYIDLGIKADRTRGEFVGKYCSSFLSKVDLSVDGECRLWGDLSYINLTGILNATGSVHVNALGTDYTLKNQLVELIPNEICFMNDTVYDKYGHHGVVSGQLHHQYLSRLTFDVNVKPYKMLCYDIPTYGSDIFYGKAFASGSCDIIGRPGQITFNVNAKAEKGSFVEYNASNPDAITGQKFINWNDRTIYKNQIPSIVDDDFKSDLRLNITANVDANSTLRVLMDSKSGDKIVLHGNGDLRATYYNKGKFALFGNYQVESGNYNMTIQNLIQKNFQFQPGSQIVFGGEPYEAQLSLKAKYPVNGVPLSDLQIGNSFKNNNVHVDCLMNINGTPEHPEVDFDLDLPTVNADAKSMIYSLLNSEQEKNQQVVYLLAVGRFYSGNNVTGDDAARQSQASLAMQSFLSGTISQQINNALGSVTKSNNWNLGANISTGDDGFYNAEYEGLLSGSLLNDRLLINGQFGYRDNPNSTSSFIGDFDVRYLLVPSGNIAVRVYNQTNDRYFTRSSLNTQGLGMIFKYDFQRLFNKRRKAIQKDLKEASKKE